MPAAPAPTGAMRFSVRLAAAGSTSGGSTRWSAIAATIRPSVIATRKAITSEKRLRNSRS
jgi:hypothetical protein